MSQASVEVNESRGNIASVSVLAESDDAIVFLVDLTRKAKRAEMELIGFEDGEWNGLFWIGGVGMFGVSECSVKFAGLDRLGESPLATCETGRYDCVVTFARRHEGRCVYMGPQSTEEPI